MSPKELALLGEVEHLVLLAALRLGDEAYAVPMRALIQTEAGVSVSRGTMYVTLERLERKGYLTSWFSDPQAVRGGKARRFFRLKPLGLSVLKQSRTAVERLSRGTALAGKPRS
jgi:PadR family transcriptional regulator PadR